MERPPLILQPCFTAPIPPAYMPTLTQRTGLKIAPLFLQSFVKHYYGKVVKDPSSSRVSLRDEELLQLMQDATTHTVEEFQSFIKARGVSLPWVNVVRALVPLSLCDLAAAHLIKACGYYFGTVDGGRSALERYAEKIQGRVFAIVAAVDYRLAPQYPFPCAIQDVLAAYLYLIQPPVGAPHRAINPNKIVIGGDSSGGGLVLAVLQVIRDAGLPLPAGGVLVSPWCDLTHSFHSITTNTETDILPATWPCRCTSRAHYGHRRLKEMTSQVHARLRMFANDVVHSHHGCERTASTFREKVPGLSDGEDRSSAPQFQFYAENRLLRHPLVSPALAYLGGLPPLFFIAGNGEVLRDEIVYTAHRAAHPDKFPLSEDVKRFYPAFEGMKDKMRATAVHLQIYDDAAHILPNLFPFATPAKFCLVTTDSTSSGSFLVHPSVDSSSESGSDDPSVDVLPSGVDAKAQERYRIVASLSQATTRLRGRSAQMFRFGNEEVSRSSSRDDGQCSKGHSSEPKEPPVVFAGAAAGYEALDRMPMIRERVSTQGIVRSLEDDDDLPAFRLSSQLVGVIPESVLERYTAAKQASDLRFASTIKGIEKARARNVEHASRDLAQRAAALRRYFRSAGVASVSSGAGGGVWRLAWALDADERPPPSSIVGRLDTEEALRFARATD
ncbi:Alpha/Beta hydrolase protein [Lactarius hatsudake]|nr:Alpha/Beta hydrolase protein [Lactarius hatsudake]